MEYYDLQTELTDHLANGIEALWNENPKLSFEEALQIEFKKFGIFGFMNVVEERQIALTKKYNGLVWQHFKDFFKLPQILGTLSAILVIYRILTFLADVYMIFMILFAVIMIFFFGGLIVMRIKNNRLNKQSGKKWLFQEIIFSYGRFAGFSYLPMQLFIHLEGISKTNYGIIFISVVLVLMILLDYILLIRIPKKSEEYLTATYPEYKLM
ncbi:hypothetical protein FLJC2902T_04630 [Flavobacterium limnosediminis JC2902]|uniref:Uncharacterized protein n=1 Tax=Flavobacterium limnosediminis JC2902 TaxID=1341181 RepID=V6STD9_9FLAO|nr:hypothetical protein FLJC2902T_04630 [Flavobacterium limnosediminis JC2902]